MANESKSKGEFESKGSQEQFEAAKNAGVSQFVRTEAISLTKDVRTTDGQFDGKSRTLFADETGKRPGRRGAATTRSAYKSNEQTASAGGVRSSSTAGQQARASAAARAQGKMGTAAGGAEAQKAAQRAARMKETAKGSAQAVTVAGLRAGVGDDGNGDEVMPDDVYDAYRTARTAQEMWKQHKAKQAAKKLAEEGGAATGPQQPGLFTSQASGFGADGSLVGTDLVRADVVQAQVALNPHAIEAANAQATAQAQVRASAKAGAMAAKASSEAAGLPHGSAAARETMLKAQRAYNVRAAMKASRLGTTAEQVSMRAGGAIARAKGALAGKTAVAGVAKVSSGGVIAAAGTVLLPVLVALVLIASLFGLSMCSGGLEQPVSAGDLTGNERIVAEYLLGKGLDALHVAAVMGNMYAENSAFDPEMNEEGNGIGFGLCQWSFERRIWLEEWAASAGRDVGDIHTQLDWLWAEMGGSDTPAAGSARPQISYAGFTAKTDLEEAVEYFMKQFERPNEDPAKNALYTKRIPKAKEYYAALTSPSGGGSGQDYASAADWQKRIVDAAYQTPFVGNNLCATWVSRVMAAAGLNYPYYQADYWLNPSSGYYYCDSTDRSQLQVGMIVAVCPSPTSSYGHVGVYIGDNKVMHNEWSTTGNAPNGCTITDLDAWLNTYRVTAYGWGYPD